MIRRIPKRRLRWLAWPLLACFVLQPIAAVQTAQASVRFEDQDSIGQATPLAPADGERVDAYAARFACELPKDVAQAQVVVARAPFDPRAWKTVPQDDAFAVADAATGLVSLSAFHLEITAPTELWWAVATTSRTNGRLRVSAVHSFTALPPFTNRVAQSPYLVETRSGVLGAGEHVVAAGPPHVRLAAGYDFAPSVDGAPQVPVELSNARIATDDPVAMGVERSYLVQFAAPPSDDERAEIARAGGVVFSYIPDQAFLVRMSEEAKTRLAAAGHALWIGEYEPAYKMSPLLADKSMPTTGQFIALVFPDADARQAAQALGLLGYTVEAISDNGINKLVRFRAPAEGLAAAAGLPAVAWVEPVAVKTVFNDQAQWVVQTNTLNDRKVWNAGIRGQGQVVNTSDSGINTTHDMFRDPAVPLLAFGDYPTHRKIIGYKLGSNSPAVTFGDHGGANSYHGSHTAGTMVGNDDALGVSAYDGMAKDAKIFFMDISGTTLANSVVPFDDLNDLYTPPYAGNAGGAARISSNSWGAPVNGAYDLNAMQIDQFTWNHKDFYIAFSTGNSTVAGSVGSPATSKNSSGMGGTQNGTSAGSIYSPTSRGPTADGRRKPTFCSPGQTVRSAQAPPSSYAALSGTSMASPSGTGAVVLMRQYLTDGFYPTGAAVPANGFNPSAALLKAMAINAADNGVLGFTAPDNNIGYGRIKIDNALYFPGDARKLLVQDNTSGLGQGQYIEYQVNVTDALQPLEVSLCWTDYPGSPAAATQLVNNLDLSVTNGVSTYKGNVFAAGVSTTGGSADNLNVEENVLVAAPSAGLWTIRVAAPAVPVGPQPFGLCITGGVGQTAGTLALDRAEYAINSTVALQVIDSDAISPLTVHISSPTEPAGEDVQLTGSNGVFNGGAQLTPNGATPSNGELSVSHGDVLTVTYTDASPAATLTANATVSTATPIITYVKATSQGAAGTLVTFNTNVNATGIVYYGTTPALLSGTVVESGMRLSHQILIPGAGLTPGTTYYYDVKAIAMNGNWARDDLGGAHYRFTAKNSADILLVVGEVGFPRLTAWQTALSALNYDYDVWTGPLADNPNLGDLSTGLRSYKAVLWQAGFDQYPPFDDTQRTAVTNYLDGGGRLATIGHDIGWALGDLTSGFSSAATQAWLAGTLKATFQADPATWSVATGYALDPISGSYTGGVPYTPVRSGGAGDEIDIAVSPPPGGPASYIWRDNAAPDDCALRWESAVPNGSAGTALWGGAPSRLVDMFFEFTALDPPFTTPSAIRQDILNKTILWLMGRDRPLVALTSPNGGETLTGSSTSITWNETIGGGYAAAGRTIEYSTDGGDSWVTLTTSGGPSPYDWDLTSVPNTTKALVRVRIVDNGAPALSQADVSNAVFTIARPGGDIDGPVVVAGSIAASPNPIIRPNAATLTATVTDQARGASAIAAAEWSIGAVAAGAGAGTPLSLGGSGVSVAVNGALDTYPFNVGAQYLWVRGQDAAGNWGPASGLIIYVNGPDPVGVTPIPTVAFLSQNAPNPFVQTTSVRYGLPATGRAELGVYNVQGRLVRRLVSGVVEAGEHVAAWDGRDDAGRRVSAGVYYYSLVTPQGRFDKRMLALP